VEPEIDDASEWIVKSVFNWFGGRECCKKHRSAVSNCTEPVYIKKRVPQSSSKTHYFLSSLHINTFPFPIPQTGQAKCESLRLPRWRSVLLAKRVFYAVRRFMIKFLSSLTLARNLPSKSLHTIHHTMLIPVATDPYREVTVLGHPLFPD
jgi:hypothetical protein